MHTQQQNGIHFEARVLANAGTLARGPSVRRCTQGCACAPAILPACMLPEGLRDYLGHLVITVDVVGVRGKSNAKWLNVDGTHAPG